MRYAKIMSSLLCSFLNTLMNGLLIIRTAKFLAVPISPIDNKIMKCLRGAFSHSCCYSNRVIFTLLHVYTRPTLDEGIITQSFLAAGRRVLEIEAAAITKQIGSINSQFENACERILACQGRVIVTGMGKSGHVAAKIAATFASTGTPSFFVHPAEASHGDLGMITPIDVVLALSNSGETSEVITILPVLKRRNIPLISITGRPESTLATQSDVHIPVIVDEEACPLNLAPTSSTTAALAMGDALAIALLEARGFSAEDFALSHPGGSLGRRLLLRVEDIMHKDDDLPSVSITTSLRDAILNISQKGLGMTA